LVALPYHLQMPLHKTGLLGVLSVANPCVELQVAGICLIDIQHIILARLLAYFRAHLNVQFNDSMPSGNVSAK
jgi:hypothetical protein